MNFKFLVLLILTAACGVKGNPVSPKDAHHPSFMENYPDIIVDQPGEEAKKK